MNLYLWNIIHDSHDAKKEDRFFKSIEEELREIRFRAFATLSFSRELLLFFRCFCLFFLLSRSFFSRRAPLFTLQKQKISQSMGKTGTEKPLKAPKKKQKELDEDDLAALARKKEEQAKLNALKKQVAGGAKLGKGLSKSK